MRSPPCTHADLPALALPVIWLQQRLHGTVSFIKGLLHASGMYCADRSLAYDTVAIWFPWRLLSDIDDEPLVGRSRPWGRNGATHPPEL